MPRHYFRVLLLGQWKGGEYENYYYVIKNENWYHVRPNRNPSSTSRDIYVSNTACMLSHHKTADYTEILSYFNVQRGP
jgi:hypothetical protein